MVPYVGHGRGQSESVDVIRFIAEATILRRYESLKLNRLQVYGEDGVYSTA